MHEIILLHTTIDLVMMLLKIATIYDFFVLKIHIALFHILT